MGLGMEHGAAELGPFDGGRMQAAEGLERALVDGHRAVLWVLVRSTRTGALSVRLARRRMTRSPDLQLRSDHRSPHISPGRAPVTAARRM